MGPGNITEILSFNPFAGHDMKAVCAGWVVIVVTDAHADSKQSASVSSIREGFLALYNFS